MHFHKNSLQETQENFYAKIISGTQKIYSNAYYTRLIEVLAEDYPALKKFVECEVFDGLCMEYVRAYPPNTYSIDDVGERFASYLSAHPLSEDAHFLPDLARMEWALKKAWLAKNIAPLTPGTPETVLEQRFVLAPATQLIQSDWDIWSWWKNCNQAEASISEEPCSVVVYRSEVQTNENRMKTHFSVDAQSISEFEYRVLTHLATPCSLETLSDFIVSLDIDEKQTASLSASFAQWRSQSVITIAPLIE